METSEIISLISRGETSSVQFKERLPNLESLAHEMIAFANTNGGMIIFGVNDKSGNLNGLSFDEINFISQQLATVASQHIFPSIFITTQTVTVNDNNLLIANIEEGISKPYKDRNGTILKKNGADKRKVTSNDEISRLLQSSSTIYADEMPVKGTSINDIDLPLFYNFIERKYKKTLEELGVSLQRCLENLNLLKNDSLTLAGHLLFCRNRQRVRPQFSVQCVSIGGTILHDSNFLDSEPSFDGTMIDVFDKAMSFIDRNIKKVQREASFNSLGVWEIPYQVFEELIVNALVHRDYFISSTIKIFVFTDRIEIVSPGKLPNSLTVENVLNGISIARNPVLLSIAQYILPYKGLGTGITRAAALYPSIVFWNDVVTEQFRVVIPRPIN